MSNSNSDTETESEPFDDLPDGTDADAEATHNGDRPSSAAAEHWADVDPEAAAAAPEAPQELELADGTPVVARYVSEGAIEETRTRVQAKHKTAGDEELQRRVIARLLREHYETPSLDFLTAEKIKDAHSGYYDKFLDPIAPELAAQARNL